MFIHTVQIHPGIATLVIAVDTVLRAEILDMFHDIPSGGHLGLYHIVHWLSHRYYWWDIYHNC